MNDMFWRFSGREQEYVAEVLQSGFGSSTTGTMNQRFEREFSKRFGVRYAVTFNSGTSTLHAALAAFGIGPGDEVIVPAHCHLLRIRRVVCKRGPGLCRHRSRHF